MVFAIGTSLFVNFFGYVLLGGTGGDCDNTS
jgi:hypothetical protein